MKILVTGATGFIGNKIVDFLLKKNHTIIATSEVNLTPENNKWSNKVIYIKHDIQQVTSDNLYKKFDKPDCLIHLAWSNLTDFKSPSHIETILPAHSAFLRNLIENGLNDLTCIGTCLEYGMQEGELNEEMEAKPIISYPIAKNFLRIQLELLQKEIPFSMKWVRLFYLFGEGQNPKSILMMLENALQNKEPSFNMSYGEQLRDYLSVNEVSENIVNIALQKRIFGIINCCSGKPISIKKLVEDYLILKGKKMKLNLGYFPYTDYEPMNFWGSTKKINSI